jgi:hypothetical protein
MSNLPIGAVKYKITQLRNRFYDAGDNDGVTMCHNLAEDLDIDIGKDGSAEDIQQEEDQ